MKKLLFLACLLPLVTPHLSGQITIQPKIKYGVLANRPATCKVGDPLYFVTDAVAGSNLFGCTSPNTWTLLGGGGGAVAPAPLVFNAANCRGDGVGVTQGIEVSSNQFTSNTSTCAYNLPTAGSNEIRLRGMWSSAWNFANPTYVKVQGQDISSAATGSTVWRIFARLYCTDSPSYASPNWNADATTPDVPLTVLNGSSSGTTAAIAVTGAGGTCATGQFFILSIRRNQTTTGTNLNGTLGITVVSIYQ